MTSPSFTLVIATLTFLLAISINIAHSSIVIKRNAPKSISNGHIRISGKDKGHWKPTVHQVVSGKDKGHWKPSVHKAVSNFLSRPSGLSNVAASKIIGGYEASKNTSQYMAMVLTFMRDEEYPNLCSGVVQSKYRVMTTAHCFKDPMTGSMNNVAAVVVLVGISDIDKEVNDRWKQLYYARRIDIAQKYSARAFANDMAIVTLTTGMPPTQRYPIIRQNALNGGEYVYASGYGQDESGEIPRFLQEVKLRFRPLMMCKKLETEFVQSFIEWNSMICASAPVLSKGGKDTCQGDSGGPLFKKDKKGQMFLFGLTSFGDPVCGSPKGAWYTKLSYFKKAIDRHEKAGFDSTKIQRNDWTRIL